MERVVVSARTARLWNYLNRGEDFFPIRLWPTYLAEMMMLEHKKNRDRFTLFFFLTGNGFEPTMARDWVLASDFKDGRVILGTYDPSAYKHMSQLIEQARSGTLFNGDKKIMDMNLGRVIPK